MKMAPWAAAGSAWIVLLAGCAFAANPQPPTLWLPEPVKDLSATRAGNEVHLHWTMPRHSTDKLQLKGDQQAHICYREEAAPGTTKKPAGAAAALACTQVADKMFAPDAPADFAARLPQEFEAGRPHALSYYVELENHAGKTAGPSNAAWVATGEAPPAVTGFRVEAEPDGVAMHWNKAGAEPHLVMRIHRTLVTRPGAGKPNESNGAPPPPQQTLEVDLDKADAGGALDHDAMLNEVWRYRAERVLRVETSGHALELEGAPSETVTIDAKNVFPPAVPQGLAAVADEQAHAIDLSWRPDSEPALAGYVVYRRDLTAGTGAERISGKAAVVPPSFDDTKVVTGHRYAYAVSAVDQDGNESRRSPEVEEELPQ